MADEATAPVKPGYRTTEGWLTFLVAILGASSTAHFVGDGSTAATICGLAASVLPTLFYTWSRTKVKS